VLPDDEEALLSSASGLSCSLMDTLLHEVPPQPSHR
jgi:hypothetical protein